MARTSGPYIGDQILAVYQALGSCCLLTVLSAGTVAAVTFTAKPTFLVKFEKENPTELWQYLNDPKYTAPLAILLGAVFILDIAWILATWRGRRWALSWHLGSSAPAVVIGLVFGKPTLGLILPLCVAIYCVLRLTGNVGPTSSKPAPAARRKAPQGKKRRKTRKAR